MSVREVSEHIFLSISERFFVRQGPDKIRAGKRGIDAVTVTVIFGIETALSRVGFIPVMKTFRTDMLTKAAV